ncbi:MAG: hypothetical protein MPW17_05180 [Candidatus Manganitrophus sp.]|nr:hypothetical protein [Candidatus Manganitrophus sp.]WDT72230.1 MAG: hypothetical protein MPW17_05180 [Candidatus Manganitrophus sp.]WDT75525.1 MAG: hypothetical protein MPW16_19930 [Candidatus Manganitrophus sp.]
MLTETVSMTETHRPLSEEIRERVHSNDDLLKAASTFKVTPSTLRKILAGKPISRFIERKIRAVREGGAESRSAHRRRMYLVRLLEVYHLYKTRGTLTAAGQEIGLSRERIRQLLTKGSEIGLFEYPPSRRPKVSREEILADYRRYLKWSAVAEIHSLSIDRMRRLLRYYRITHKELCAIRTEGRKERCIALYKAAAGALGHHPTTTEMQGICSTRYLATQIRKLWGSIASFREELKIETPLHANLRRAREKKVEVFCG